MERSHWTALQTVYPPDQIKTINWASLNKHIHNSLDLLRQSANSLNELSHTSSSSQNLPLWTCLLTDLSHQELKTPIGCGSGKEWDGAAVVVTEQLVWEQTPGLPWVMVWPQDLCCDLPPSWSVVWPATLMAQGSILHTLRQSPGGLWGFCLEIFCNLFPVITYLQEEKQEWKQIHEKHWTTHPQQAHGPSGPPSTIRSTLPFLLSTSALNLELMTFLWSEQSVPTAAAKVF